MQQLSPKRRTYCELKLCFGRARTRFQREMSGTRFVIRIPSSGRDQRVQTKSSVGQSRRSASQASEAQARVSWAADRGAASRRRSIEARQARGRAVRRRSLSGNEPRVQVFGIGQGPRQARSSPTPSGEAAPALLSLFFLFFSFCRGMTIGLTIGMTIGMTFGMKSA